MWAGAASSPYGFWGPRLGSGGTSPPWQMGSHVILCELGLGEAFTFWETSSLVIPPLFLEILSWVGLTWRHW